CEACHSNTAWSPVNRVDHAQVGTDCNSCHNGNIAIGKPSGHVPTTSQCSGCHSTTAWLPAANHTQPSPACITCHDGTIATGKNATHVSTTNVCESCHSQSSWVPVVSVDHLEVLGACVTCHNGTIAVGKNATHASTTDKCEACHTTQPLVWSNTPNIDHTQVLGTCASCHNGSIARGAPSVHFSNTLCDACHSTRSWGGVNTYSHSLSYDPLGHRGGFSCSECHKQDSDTVTYKDNATYAPDCAGCHANDYEPGEHKNVSVSSLRDCESSCHEPGPEHLVSDKGF
ncbi:hypothetical protein MNBD_GAMMA07-255, partial [hydrothermal vent metagenome]